MDLEEGQEVLRVPLNFIIYPSRILDATVVGQVLTPKIIEDLRLNDSDIIAFYLAYMKTCKLDDKANPWEYWLQSLPDRVDNIWFFNEPELKYLEGSSVGGDQLRSSHSSQRSKET